MLWFVTLLFDDGLLIGTFDGYLYILRIYIYSSVQLCGCDLLLSISYSFKKSSVEVSRLWEVEIPESCFMRDRVGRRTIRSITS